MIGNEKENRIVVDNPYVGPRAFEKEDKDLYFGRRQEADEILSLLMARRLLLLYAQSGAGKTSLINAQLIPTLENVDPDSEDANLGDWQRQFEVPPVGRVSDAIKLDSKVDNLFAFNLMVSLAGDSQPDRFAKLRLSDFLLDSVYIDGRLDYIGGAGDLDEVEENQELVEEIEEVPMKPRALIIDQFEELFTYHPELEEDRIDFIKQLNEAMENDPYLYILLSMRDDYVARISPYVHMLPNGLRTRYYMQRMEEPAALEAIRFPPQKANPPRRYDKKVSDKLVKFLRLSGSPDEGSTGELEQLDPYVEPVQLQVVCYQLWESLDNTAGGNITMEEVNDVIIKILRADGRMSKLEGDPLAAFIDTALAGFYEQAIAGVMSDSATNISEFQLRNFFTNELITAAGIRNLVARGKESTKDIPESAIKLLEDKYHLIRNDMRGGRPFVELVHDSFIEPIQEANRRWEDQRLQQITWLADARSYQESPDLTPLLVGDNLKQAQAQADNMDELPPEAKAYLEASTKAQESRQKKIRSLSLVGIVLLALVLGALALNFYTKNQELEQITTNLTEVRDKLKTANDELKQEEDKLTIVNDALEVEKGNLTIANEALEVERGKLRAANVDLQALRLGDKAANYLANNKFEAAILMSYQAEEISPTLRVQFVLFDAMNSKLTSQPDLESAGVEQLRSEYMAPVDSEQNKVLVDNLFPGPERNSLATVNNGQILWWQPVEGREDPPVAETFSLQLGAEDASVDLAVFSQDHDLLATSRGPELRLWRTNSAAGQDSILLGEGKSTVTALAFSADGRRLAVARGCPAEETGGCSTHAIDIWDIDSANPGVINYIPTGAPVVDLAFSDEQGDKLVWSSPNLIGIEALTTGESDTIDRLAEPFIIYALAVVLDQDLLVIAGCEKSEQGSTTGEISCDQNDSDFLQWWYLSEQNLSGLRSRTQQGTALSDVVLLGEKEKIVFIDNQGNFKGWSADIEDYNAQACRIAGRTLTAAEWKDAFPDSSFEKYKTKCDDHNGIHISIVEELLKECNNRDALAAKAKWEKYPKTASNTGVENFADWAAGIVTTQIMPMRDDNARDCLEALNSVLEDQSALESIDDVIGVKKGIAEAQKRLNDEAYDEAFQKITAAAAIVQNLPDGFETAFGDEVAAVYEDLCKSKALNSEDGAEACRQIPDLEIVDGDSEAIAEQRFWKLVDGKAGDYITIGVTAEEGDAWLKLYDDQFGELAFNNDFDGFNPQINAFLAQNGLYKLEVGWAGDPAPYTMSAAVARPETITLDDTVKKANAEQSVWQFNGEAGNFVTIEVQAEEGEPWLKLYNGQFNIQSESVLVPRIEALLPEEGDYYLELGWFDEAQPYTLSTAVMEPETILLGDEVEANAEQKVWQFEGKAGEQVTINVTAAEGRNPWLALYNSNYENLLYNDNFEGLNPQVELLLPEDGPYYLQVGWVDDPGPYVMKTEVVTGKDVASFGTSGNGTPLTYYQYGEGPQPIIFIGGIHAGFAPSSVKMAERLIAHLEENPDEIPENATVYIIPNLNPDSVYAPGELDGRFNSFGVDLNRNWNCIWQTDATILGIPRTGGGGREAFSEPEVKALRKFITNYDFILNKKPAAILFWGARATNGLVSPGSCGPVPEVSQPLADVYGAAAGFKVLTAETIGAPLSGDVSNWLDSFGIPAAFVLLKDYEDFKWEENLEGVRAVLQEFGK